MPNILETTTSARRILPIFYVIDSSGSMIGDKISSVNEAMRDSMEVLKDIAAENPDAEVKVAALEFSNGAKWVTSSTTLEDLEDFFWNDIKAAGCTELGEALTELEAKMSRSAFLVSDTSVCIPIIIFMSDGAPTDNWMPALDKAMSNKWYNIATKIAIAVGADADKEVLAKVVGSSESVMEVTEVDVLKKLIKAATVTSSKIGSKSRTTANGNAATQIIHATITDLGDDAKKVKVGVSGQPGGSSASTDWDTSDWD